MSEYANVKINIEERVAVLSLDHPRANTLDRATIEDLDKAIDELIADDRAKVIIITGAGRLAFSAGADVNEMGTARSAEEVKEFILKGHAVFGKVAACPKPVIAAINAMALGGGLELALACHIRIASERARIGQPESNLGIIPGWGGTQRLPRLIGPAKAIEMILTGDPIDAQEAFRLGLVNKVAPADEVLSEAMSLAGKIAAKSRLTNEASLRAVYGGLKTTLAEGLLLEVDQFSALLGSRDASEGISAFLQKRQPEFTDS